MYFYMGLHNMLHFVQIHYIELWIQRPRSYNAQEYASMVSRML